MFVEKLQISGPYKPGTGTNVNLGRYGGERRSYLERKPEGAGDTKASFSEALSRDWAREEGADQQGHRPARAGLRAGFKQTETDPAWPPTCCVILGRSHTHVHTRSVLCFFNSRTRWLF